MYILVRDVVEKCTENCEGVKLSQICEKANAAESIKVDFFGIIQVTDDFLFGFLSQLKNTETSLTQLQYVRTPAYIRRKIQKVCQVVGQ
ncbi:hypothetical protein DYBT9275_02772 [Dyadobacter sp. CECT 9275]|uniref:DUF4325 domain-containing protein n=1 Tax=Dyadobacter helix TaxID=2822344 RepID=A0A916JCQ0_9BACT|nr:hypothetical protein DYBT9275_02772 [Dyadobacter sp. CECT 9275]